MALNRYSYVLNNPLRYNDPSGHWLDTLIDIASIVYDVHDIATNGLNWENGLSLAADVVSLALPVVTGGGAMVHAAMHADDAVHVATHLDDAVRAAEHIDEATEALAHADDAAEVLLHGGDELAEASKAAETLAASSTAGESLGKAFEGISTGSNTVYRYVDENGITRYIGITNNFTRRAGEHLRGRGWVIREIPGLDHLNRSDARAVEQVLIERFGLSRNGGTLLNKINSIAPRNPIYPEAIQRGREILDLIGFPY